MTPEWRYAASRSPTARFPASSAPRAGWATAGVRDARDRSSSQARLGPVESRSSRLQSTSRSGGTVRLPVVRPHQAELREQVLTPDAGWPERSLTPLRAASTGARSYPAPPAITARVFKASETIPGLRRDATAGQRRWPVGRRRAPACWPHQGPLQRSSRGRRPAGAVELVGARERRAVRRVLPHSRPPGGPAAAIGHPTARDTTGRHEVFARACRRQGRYPTWATLETPMARYSRGPATPRASGQDRRVHRQDQSRHYDPYLIRSRCRCCAGPTTRTVSSATPTRSAAGAASGASSRWPGMSNQSTWFDVLGGNLPAFTDTWAVRDVSGSPMRAPPGCSTNPFPITLAQFTLPATRPDRARRIRSPRSRTRHYRHVPSTERPMSTGKPLAPRAGPEARHGARRRLRRIDLAVPVAADYFCLGGNCKCPPGKVSEIPHLVRCRPGPLFIAVTGGSQAGSGPGHLPRSEGLLPRPERTRSRPQRARRDQWRPAHDVDGRPPLRLPGSRRVHPSALEVRRPRHSGPPGTLAEEQPRDDQHRRSPWVSRATA